MRISDWSSDVCSSDLVPQRLVGLAQPGKLQMQRLAVIVDNATAASPGGERILEVDYAGAKAADVVIGPQAIAGQVLAGSRRGVDQAADQPARRAATAVARSEEHTSELQSLMRHSYAVFCLKKKTR